jgi:bacterioferritin-associated ferredoxin
LYCNILIEGEGKMYVCLCNALTTRDVEKVKERGVCNPTQVYKSLGCKMQCGKCLETINNILQDGNSSLTKKSIKYLKNTSIQVQV